MDESIYEKNRELQRKLDHLLKQARANEKKQKLYETFGFEIIGASTPKQLRDLLLSQTVERFQLLDVVLCLVDYHKDTERLFFERDEEAQLSYENKLLILDTLKDAEIIHSLAGHSVLGVEALKNYRWMIANLKKPQSSQKRCIPAAAARRADNRRAIVAQPRSASVPGGHWDAFLAKNIRDGCRCDRKLPQSATAQRNQLPRRADAGV